MKLLIYLSSLPIHWMGFSVDTVFRLPLINVLLLPGFQTVKLCIQYYIYSLCFLTFSGILLTKLHGCHSDIFGWDP